MIGRGTFHSTEELEKAIYHWLANWNCDPSPFVWKASAGTPFTALNGSDRNNVTVTTNDRPDIGNPNAPLNSPALIPPSGGPLRCDTGFRYPDNTTRVTPGDRHWTGG